MKKPIISVIIVTYNSADYIKKCLESVLLNRSSSLEIEIFISDNGSKDSTIKIISQNFKTVKIIQNNKNLGFSGGVNSALTVALKTLSDYFFILNPDTVIKPDTIFNLYKHRNKADILSPKIYFTNKPNILWYAGGKIDWKNCYGRHIGVNELDSAQHDQIREIDYSTGCGELISRNVFEKVGPMNEKYFLYMEDIDFSLRAKKLGFKILFIPDSVLFHHNAKSSSVGSPIQDYFFTRNRLYFALHYADIRTKVAVVRQSLGFLINGRKAQKWGVVDFFSGKMGEGSIFKKI